MTSIECLCMAFWASLLVSLLVAPWLVPSLTIPGVNLRYDAQAIVSCEMPECQMNAANTALMLSATEGLIASVIGPEESV